MFRQNFQRANGGRRFHGRDGSQRKTHLRDRFAPVGGIFLIRVQPLLRGSEVAYDRAQAIRAL